MNRSRRWALGASIALVVASSLWYLSKPTPALAQSPKLGMNLSGVVDWSTEFPFVDVFKMARPWVSQAKGKPWGQGGALELDANGNVKKLADGQYAETLLFVDIGNHYPGGDYVCLFDGQGELEFSSAAKMTKKAPGRIEITIDPSKNQVNIKLLSTEPSNPVKNIRLIKADAEKTYTEKIFQADFLERYRGMQVIRFMDWQHTNNSKLVSWKDRATRKDLSQALNKGVCYEYQLALANDLGVDPWVCVPHLADDDFITALGKLCKETLKKERKIYLEYSNETWNGQFEQARYCRKMGLEKGLSKNDYEAQLRYSAQRSVEIFKLFQAAFGDDPRVVRVLAMQSANPWTGTTAMDWKDAYKNADAIAIAPYFGNALGDPKSADQVAKMSVTEVLAACKKSIDDNRKVLETYAKEAKKRKLRLLAYEGGQHLAGYAGAENNEALTKLFHAANRDPGMKDLYTQDLKQWAEISGDIHVIFASVGRYGKYGSWGVLEYGDQDPKTAPKWQAIQNLLAK